MGYLYLILTILSETIAVLLMKASNGFQNKMVSAFAVTAYVLSFVFLTLALKKMPMGIANAIWAGASTVLVVIAGWFFFKESISMKQLFFLLLIVIGLIGLNWGNSTAA